jgi:hypothetical protein
LQNNFKPTALSPLVDAGYNVLSLNINFDFDFYPRPYSNAFDIGAYEYYLGNLVNEDFINSNEINIILNPNNGIFKLILNSNKLNTICKIFILNQLGENIFNKNINSDEIQNIDISKITKSGIYFIILHSENYHIIKKLIIQ